MVKRKNEQGSVFVILLCALSVLMLSAMGTWWFIRRWRHLAETQFRLDRCVARTALRLATTQEYLILLNQILRYSRYLSLPAKIYPPAGVAIESIMKIAVGGQELLKHLWIGQQGVWIAAQGCDFKLDIPIPLPSLKWRRNPPDLLGPGVLKWMGPPKDKLKISLRRLPRLSSAWVYVEEGTSDTGTWSTDWKGPDWVKKRPTQTNRKKEGNQNAQKQLPAPVPQRRSKP